MGELGLGMPQVASGKVREEWSTEGRCEALANDLTPDEGCRRNCRSPPRSGLGVPARPAPSLGNGGLAIFWPWIESTSEGSRRDSEDRQPRHPTGQTRPSDGYPVPQGWRPADRPEHRVVTEDGWVSIAGGKDPLTQLLEADARRELEDRGVDLEFLC